MKPRTRHLLWIASLAPLAAFLAITLHLEYWWSIILFFGLPSALLTLWEPRHIGRALRFSLALLPLGIAVDVVMHVSSQWWVTTSLPWRLFGVMPLEDIAWPFLYIYMLVLAYEHFWNDHRQQPNRRLPFFAIAWLVSLCLCLTALISAPTLLQWPYAYLVMGAFIIIGPLLYESWRFPKLMPRFVHFGLFFLPYLLIYEFTALELGWWHFPGLYVGWLSVGSYDVPLEELLIWIVFGSAGFMALYEYFADDNR